MRSNRGAPVGAPTVPYLIGSSCVRDMVVKFGFDARDLGARDHNLRFGLRLKHSFRRMSDVRSIKVSRPAHQILIAGAYASVAPPSAVDEAIKPLSH
jgi:hypothetical protein